VKKNVNQRETVEMTSSLLECEIPPPQPFFFFFFFFILFFSLYFKEMAHVSLTIILSFTSTLRVAYKCVLRLETMPRDIIRSGALIIAQQKQIVREDGKKQKPLQKTTSDIDTIHTG